MSNKEDKNRITAIKKLIAKECKTLGFAPKWFYDIHLLGVEKFAKKLLRQLPKADKEIVMLGVWLHDLQRIRGIKGDHAKIGAREAEKVMRDFNYEESKIKNVKGIILSHTCSTDLKPKTLEGKILSSADAMAHYINDFYLAIAVTGQRNLKEYKDWVVEKLNRNYNKKIYFNFAKKMIKKRHDIFKAIFTMN